MTVRMKRVAWPRGLLLASTALAGVVASSSAFAACNPAAAFNVTASCTGTTVNQNGTTGYGGLFNSLNVTVQSGASVTGSNDGIQVFQNSLVTNFGTITGTTLSGVYLAGSTSALNNFGTITGGNLGVLGDAVTNSGTISGTRGIGGSTLTLTNSGTITGTTNVAIDAPTATINNSGTVTSPFVAVNAPTKATITNSGTMTSGFRTLLIGNGIVNNSGLISVTGADTNLAIYNITGNLAVTNSGTITSSGTGVAGLAAVSVVNSGTMVAVGYPVYAQGALTVTNSGTIRATGLFYDAMFSGTTANVTNSGLVEALDANGYALLATGAATVNNSGTMNGGIGIFGSSVTLTNSGTVRGRESFAVYSNSAFNITNSGNIIGLIGIGTNGAGGTLVNSGTIIGQTSDGVNHAQTLNLTNSGTISGGRFGVGANTAANTIIATNSGTIFGTNVGLRANATGNVTNSGTISGGSGTAIQFGAVGGPASDTLTVQYGARFGGLVDFGFGADTVNFAKGSWILDVAKFNAAASTINTMGNPYFVTPNQIIVVDNSSFAALNRAVMDITGWIASVLPDTPRPVAGSVGGSSAAALAPIDSMETRFADVFDAFPRDALGYAKAPVFKAAAANYADGSTVWAKGFGGRREQTGSATILGNITTGYGGAIGYERSVARDVRAGALVGASTNRTELAANQGTTDTDVFFGGLYARYMPGATFLDLAVIGGMLDNSGARNIFGPLAMQTARADYDGWFVNPQATLGHAFALDANSATTLTPAIKARYVGAHFDGYTETGSTVNLAVGARDLHAFEERGQLTLAAVRDFGSWSRIAMHMTGGVLAQQRSGGATVSLGLFGQNILAATPDKANTAGVFGATGFDWQIGNLMVFSAAEFTATDDSNRTVSAKGGVRYVW